MNCVNLVERIQGLQDNASPHDVLRMSMLLCNAVDDIDDLQDHNQFEKIWSDVNLRLHAATDQHSAMTSELEELAKSDPQKFTPDQIWVLIRAIKVQSQVLRLYTGDPQYELN